jgi:hypothetical protein
LASEEAVAEPNPGSILRREVMLEVQSLQRIRPGFQQEKRRGDVGATQNLITRAQLPDKIPWCRSPLIFCQAD